MLPRLIMLLFISTAALAGCQNQQDTSLPNKETDNKFIQVKDSHPREKQILTNKQIANHLAHTASSVPHVNDAAAIIAGPYTVVGIDVDKDLDRSRVGTIKFTVLEAMQHDPYGKTAVIVADADVMERIRNIGKSVKQGQPVQGVIDELSAIVGRYMPDFPITDDQPEEEDETKKLLPKQDEKKLQDIQEKQSNKQLKH